MDIKLFKALSIAAVIVLVYSFLLVPLGTFHKARLLSKDLITRYIYKLSSKPSQIKDIVVISIDRESLRKMEQKWPWDRGIFAQLLLKLRGYQTKTIYLDFAFIGETEHDETLAQAMTAAGNVIIPFYFDEKGEPLFPAQRLLASVSGFGPVNKLRDEDLVVRDALLVYFSAKGGIIDYSVELITICKYFGVTIGEVSLDKDRLIIDIGNNRKVKVPLSRNGTLPINYNAALDNLTVVPFWEAIKEDFPQETFKNKIVIVGLTDKSLLDIYRTPLGVSSGVEIIVNTILTVISGDFIKYTAKDIDFPVTLLMILLIAFTVFRMPSWKGFFLCLLEIMFYFLIVFLLALYGYRFEMFSVFFLGFIIYIIIKIYKFVCLLREQNIELQEALSNLKEAEAEIIESAKLAAMGRISAQISHEIKNPLCAIKNSINTIVYIVKHGIDKGQIDELKEIVNVELDRLTKLSQDILSFSRPAKEEEKLVNVNKIIEETSNVYREQLEKQDIHISLNLSNNIPDVIASLDKLKQVFSNMILNSQEAMLKGGILKITTELLDRYVEISINDTGCGIPDEIVRRIFEPFFTTKEDGKGTGLGLFVVYNIIKGYSGSISVESRVGQGTTFIIKLPVK